MNVGDTLNGKRCCRISYWMMMTMNQIGYSCSDFGSRPEADIFAVLHSEFGYVMATHYSDQMTGSAPNLVSLQCWASTLGPSVRVVEPFVRHSRLGVNLYAASNASAPETENNSVRLRDVLDLKEWERQTTKIRKYASLVSWDHFLTDAPRKLILVDRECADSNHGCMDCDSDAQNFAKSSKLFAREYNFHIVRRVCFPRMIMKESIFRELVYANYDPKDVVVIFNSWGGIEHKDFNWRVGIKMNACRRCTYFHDNPFSKTIVQDASNFIQKYMPDSGDYRYISVMIRLEHFKDKQDFFESVSMELGLSLIKKCFDNIVHDVDQFKKMYNLSEVFLTSDCSKHGSAGIRLISSERNEMMVKATARLYERIYNNSSSLETMDDIFSSTASFNTPGYIALLHKYLAARGACILTAGGGSFQSSARSLYNTYHLSGPRCVRTISGC